MPKVLVDSVMDCNTRDEDRQDEGGTRLHGTLVALSLVPLAMSAASTAAAQDVSKLDPKGYSGSTHDRNMTQQCQCARRSCQQECSINICDTASCVRH